MFRIMHTNGIMLTKVLHIKIENHENLTLAKDLKNVKFNGCDTYHINIVVTANERKGLCAGSNPLLHFIPFTHSTAVGGCARFAVTHTTTTSSESTRELCSESDVSGKQRINSYISMTNQSNCNSLITLVIQLSVRFLIHW